MKNPLNYQTTEYDCGPTTLTNAVRYLFPREAIPPDILRHISIYSLDTYNRNGELGKNGTSALAMMFISNWLNEYAKYKKFPIHSEFLSDSDVAVGPGSKIAGALQQGGAVVLRLFLGCWHYVLLTGVDDESFYLFDPYYRVKPFSTPGVEKIDGLPCRMNRKIRRDVIGADTESTYAIGPASGREAVILFNTKTQRTPEKTIEYFI